MKKVSRMNYKTVVLNKSVARIILINPVLKMSVIVFSGMFGLKLASFLHYLCN